METSSSKSFLSEAVNKWITFFAVIVGRVSLWGAIDTKTAVEIGLNKEEIIKLGLPSGLFDLSSSLDKGKAFKGVLGGLAVVYIWLLSTMVPWESVLAEESLMESMVEGSVLFLSEGGLFDYFAVAILFSVAATGLYLMKYLLYAMFYISTRALELFIAFLIALVYVVRYASTRDVVKASDGIFSNVSFSGRVPNSSYELPPGVDDGIEVVGFSPIDLEKYRLKHGNLESIGGSCEEDCSFSISLIDPEKPIWGDSSPVPPKVVEKSEVFQLWEAVYESEIESLDEYAGQTHSPFADSNPGVRERLSNLLHSRI